MQICFLIFKADVLVNTTSADFDFSKNACAKALNDAAGPDLLRQCRQHGNLQIGEILQTSGGDLYCHVFHVTCSRWENGKGANVSLFSCFYDAFLV